MRALLSLLLLAACNGKTEPPVGDTDEPVVEPDETADTFASEVESDAPWDSSDTGSRVEIYYNGWAFVDPGASLNGWETISVHWVRRGGALREPGCVLAYEAKDWANDPIRAGLANPLAANLSACATCAFTFTVSTSNPALYDHFPWDDLEQPDDTDPDTDPPAPRGDGRPLSCASLQAEGALPEFNASDTEWYGYGFDPTLVGTPEDNLGAWMLWLRTEATWIPYSEHATFTDGVFRWQKLYYYYY